MPMLGHENHGTDARSEGAQQNYRIPRSNRNVATNYSADPMNSFPPPNPIPDSIGGEALSVALISPDERRRIGGGLGTGRLHGM